MNRIVLCVAVLCLAGCGTTVQQNWVAQNKDFNETVVRRVLWPHYDNDPNVDPVAKANVGAAIQEHERNLADWEGNR